MEMDILEEWGVLSFVDEINCVLLLGGGGGSGVVWLGVVLGWFSVGVVMCEGGVIIWFVWVIGINCGVVEVFACQVGVVVGVVGGGKVKKV